MARKRQPFPDINEAIDTKTYLKDVAKELHKPIKHKFPTRSVIVNHKDQTWSMDLADMSTWKDSNDGVTYILTSVDVYTRWAAARPLKSKSAKDVLDAIKDIVAESGRKPSLLWVDEGKEFKNRELTAWRKANDIGLYHTYGRGKSVIVERFNRTLKTMMWRELTARNTHEWIDILPELIDTYNNTKHSKLKMTPNEASAHPEKVAKVWAALRKEQREPTKPKFKIGDVVRISRSKGLFEKGYDVNWSREVFRISSVDERNPPMYHIIDRRDEEIKGSFYNEELQHVKHPDVFLIDHVIKEKGKGSKKQLFVRWLGYGPQNDSWILASDSTLL